MSFQRPLLARPFSCSLTRFGTPLALSLVLACIGGDELRSKSARQAQIAAAETADTQPETLPRDWKRAREPAWGEPRADRATRNLFAELGKSDAEVDEKVRTAVNRFFGIGTNEPAELIRGSGYRVY